MLTILGLVLHFYLTKLLKILLWDLIDRWAKKQILSCMIPDFSKAFNNSNRESEIQMSKKNQSVVDAAGCSTRVNDGCFHPKWSFYENGHEHVLYLCFC